MAEQRKKSDSILLRTEGKIISLELFPSTEWPDEDCGEGLYRVRVNDVWHCPVGKYSFLTRSAIGDLVAAQLNDGELPTEDPAPYLPYLSRVKVELDAMPFFARGSVHVPPYQKRDGRWYAQVWVPGGIREVCCDKITLINVRR